MLSELAETWRYRAVIQNFVWTSLGVRYRRSVFGYLWSVMSPVAKYAIMGLVFSIIGRFDLENYFGFMFIGSVFFGFVSTVIGQATIAFIANEQYIKKIYIPKLVFIMNVVLNELVNFVLILLSITGLLLVMGEAKVSIAWTILPLAILITLFLLIGVASLVAVATTWFRDLQHLVDIFFQALFFATPIFYPLSVLASHKVFFFLVQLNPLTYYVSLFREPLVYGVFPELTAVAGCLIGSILVMLAGLLILKKFNNRIVFQL